MVLFRCVGFDSKSSMTGETICQHLGNSSRYLFLMPKNQSLPKGKQKKHPSGPTKLVHICLVWKTHRAFYINILRFAWCGYEKWKYIPLMVVEWWFAMVERKESQHWILWWFPTNPAHATSRGRSSRTLNKSFRTTTSSIHSKMKRNMTRIDVRMCVFSYS